MSYSVTGPSSHERRVSALGWLALGLALLYLTPILAFKYFPSQDGPSHIENSYMLCHYFDKDARYGEYYDLNLRPFPNWLSHASMALVMKLAPPLAAERVLLAGYVVLFVLAVFYFLKATTGRADWLALVALALVYNNLLHSGYYNFSISVPLVFVTIGYWWKRRDLARPDWWGRIGVNLLLLLVYSCNVLSEGIALMSLVVLAAIHYRERVRRTIALALALVPACILPAYYVAAGHGEPAGRSGAGQLVGYLATFGSLVSFSPRERYVGIALALVLAALLAVGLASRLGLRRRTGGEVRDGFLGLAGAIVLLYFLAPARAFGGGSITYRLSLFPPIMILPWLAANVPSAVRRTAGIAALGVALVHLGFTVEACKVFNRGLAEYTSGISVVAPNSTILPISFDHKGESAKVGVYRHAGSYYCLGNGVIDLANYEGDKSYFPLRYKSSLNPWAIIGSLEGIRGTIRPDRYPRPVDYILLWSAPPQFAVRPWIEANYALVHSQGRLMIYKRKATSLGWRG